jgi:pimeloyl-ACP methyl ester carboxylesterase
MAQRPSLRRGPTTGWLSRTCREPAAMSDPAKTDYQTFPLGDVALQSGMTYRGAFLAYKTYGRLNADKSNVIVFPTSYGAQHYDTEWLIGEGMALDPRRYFIVIPNMFGNGLSSSPSNAPPPYDRGRYPQFTMFDNVMLQHRLLREMFGIERVRLVVGWSMGGTQAFHWGRCFPRWSSASRRSAPPPDARGTTSCSWRGSRRRLPRTRTGRMAGSPNSRFAGCAPWGGSMPAGRCRRPSTGKRFTRP